MARRRRAPHQTPTGTGSLTGSPRVPGVRRSVVAGRRFIAWRFIAWRFIASRSIGWRFAWRFAWRSACRFAWRWFAFRRLARARRWLARAVRGSAGGRPRRRRRMTRRRTHCRRRTRRRPWTGWWRRPPVRIAMPVVVVVRPLRVPGTSAVPGGPVGVETEGDDRYPERHTVAGDDDGAACSRHLQVARGDPAAVRAGLHVTPAVALLAAEHLHVDAGRQQRDGRVLDGGSGAHVHGGHDRGRESERRRRMCRHRRDGDCGQCHPDHALPADGCLHDTTLYQGLPVSALSAMSTSALRCVPPTTYWLGMQVDSYCTLRVVKSGRMRCLICSMSSQSPATSRGSRWAVRSTNFQRALTVWAGAAPAAAGPAAAAGCSTFTLMWTLGKAVGRSSPPAQPYSFTDRSGRAPSISSVLLILSRSPSQE